MYQTLPSANLKKQTIRTEMVEVENSEDEEEDFKIA